ncbi:MAG: HDOD domain-containing protein [Candidatus Hydrogenedentes bacterium]|nr:HDOD domain-containing protein [Candidatus Hydrogenedentota bacterium]
MESTDRTTETAGARSGAAITKNELELRTGKLRLVRRLVDAGVLSQNDIGAAQQQQRERGGDLVDLLLAAGVLDIKTVLEYIASDSATETANQSLLEIPVELRERIPAKVAQTFGIVPLEFHQGMLIAGIADPVEDAAIDELETIIGLPLKLVLCHRDDIVSAIGRYYPAGPNETGEAPLEGLEAPLRLSRVRALLREVKTLPALPETVDRVREATYHPDSSVGDVVDIILLDPPVAGKVLGVANSPAYGFAHQINELKLAVSLMGLRETYSVVLSTAVVDLLGKLKHVDYQLFWLESLCAATASRIVAKRTGRGRLSGVFTAGLLHDIGRAALWEVAPEPYRKISSTLTGNAIVEAELEVFGLSHAEAGYELAQHWNFPEDIAEAIRYHHAPHLALKRPEYAAITSLGEAMVQARGLRVEENRHIFTGQEAAMEILGIDLEIAEAILEEYIERHEAAVQEALEGTSDA